MSIIQRFLTNQIAANEIIIVMTPYCPTPQHLLHMQEGVNLLSLKTFGESKCHVYLNSLWNNSQTHYSDARWCTSKWTLGHRRKKKGETMNSPCIPNPSMFTCNVWIQVNDHIFSEERIKSLIWIILSPFHFTNKSLKTLTLKILWYKLSIHVHIHAGSLMHVAYTIYSYCQLMYL